MACIHLTDLILIIDTQYKNNKNPLSGLEPEHAQAVVMNIIPQKLDYVFDEFFRNEFPMDKIDEIIYKFSTRAEQKARDENDHPYIDIVNENDIEITYHTTTKDDVCTHRELQTLTFSAKSFFDNLE